MPSHCDIPGNKRADSFVAASHSKTPSVTINHFVEACTIIRDSVPSVHPDINLISFLLPSLQRMTGVALSLLHRLCADCTFTKKTLHLVGRSKSPFCGACGVIQDVFSIYYGLCSYKDVLENSVHSASRRYSSLHHWLFLWGSPGSVRCVFGALLQFLEQLGLAICL